jgi:hypothetical protein
MAGRLFGAPLSFSRKEQFMSQTEETTIDQRNDEIEEL